MSKNVLFFVFTKKFFWPRHFENISFYIIQLDFQVFLAILKVRLNDVEILFIFFNGHFLIIMGFKI